MVELINPLEPNLVRGLFPYTEVPKLGLDPSLDPGEVFITDTTFRDGQQARPPYTTEQIVDLYRLLNNLDNDSGVIRQSEFFLYSNKDREAVELCKGLGFRYPEITGWIRANPKDFQLVKQAGLKETGILTSASDYHIYLKLGWDREKALENYLAIVREAISNEIVPRCHFEDITRADFPGFVLPFAEKLMEVSQEAGMPVKIRACDTMGYGLPYREACLPRSVPRIFEALKSVGVPSELLEWHGHNDFHLVLANALTAWLYGCSGVNCTLLGFGERTGNTPLEGMIMHYLGLKEDPGLQTKAITEIAGYLQGLGMGTPGNYPLVGAYFNTTRAGIHADGILKNPEIYSIFDTVGILGVEPGVTVTDKSGVAGVAHWINKNIRFDNKDYKLDKEHPAVRAIYSDILRQYEDGRTTGISPEEMLELTKTHMPEAFISDFDKIEEKARELAINLIERYAAFEDLRAMNPVELQRRMIEIVDENHFIQAAFVTDDAGRLVTVPAARSEFSGMYRHFMPGTDCSDREWFKEPLRTRDSHVTGFYDSRITHALCITAATPVQNGKLVGILSIDLNFKELAKLV